LEVEKLRLPVAADVVTVVGVHAVIDVPVIEYPYATSELP